MNLENAAIGAALGSIIAMLGYMTVKTMLDNSMGGLVPDINFSAYLPPSGSAVNLIIPCEHFSYLFLLIAAVTSYR